MNDGVTVTKEVELEDAVENIGAKLVMQAAAKRNDLAGTTTFVVLKQGLISKGVKVVAAGANPVQITKERRQRKETPGKQVEEYENVMNIERGLELPQWGCTRRRSGSCIRYGPVSEQSPLDPRGLKDSNRARKEKKKKRGLWTEEAMKSAIADIECGRRKIREASRYYFIPESSIRAWLDGKVKSKESGPKTVLTKEEEKSLVEWCETRQRVAHCVSLTLLKGKVKLICEGRVTPFQKGIPGRSWWYWFQQRHPHLVLRRPEDLDTSRAKGLSKEICDQFYTFLTNTYEEGRYPPSRIWNADETGLSASQTNSSIKVIGVKGSRNVSTLNTTNRQWMTILVCINAMGHSIPNLYISSASRKWQNFVNRCEPGAQMALQKNGWIDEAIFCEWLDHFKDSVPGGVSPEKKHLLLVDGHSSHITLDVVTKATSYGIDIALLPPHTSHKLQPLDVSIFKSFKAHFNTLKESFKEANPAWSNGNFDRSYLAELASKALREALSASNIQAGFRKSGIYPLNVQAMDEEIGPSSVFINLKTMKTENVFNTRDVKDFSSETNREFVGPIHISWDDIQALDPGQFLNDTIIDFYIRHIQNEQLHDLEWKENLYFFNCFFYTKAKESLDFEDMKKWTKGIKVFSKDYLLVPIHENLHWSLVVIQTGHRGISEQIILHFDSLDQGHDSNAIFGILKRYLVSAGADEHHEVIYEKILHRRVSDNGYDCGVFLLYYVKKFMEDAPQKLIFQNLDEIFNHNWFLPKEASSLRGKIQEIMLEEFGRKKEFTNNSNDGPLSKILDIPAYQIREPKVNVARDLATRHLITSHEFISHAKQELASKLEKIRIGEEQALAKAISKMEKEKLAVQKKKFAAEKKALASKKRLHDNDAVRNSRLPQVLSKRARTFVTPFVFE